MTQTERVADVARRLGVVGHPSVAQITEAVAVFAPFGWAMCSRWHYEGTLRVLRKAAQGVTTEELDEAITEVWNTENLTWLGMRQRLSVDGRTLIILSNRCSGIGCL